MRAPQRSTVVRAAAAAAAGSVLALSRPPAGLGVLACVGLVPLFVAWRDRGALASAGYAFVAGFVYYAIVCSWIRYFGIVAILPFTVAAAAYWALAGALVGWLRVRFRISSPWLTAAVWVLADALVARVPLGGLSWGELGYALHDAAPARAVASVGGVTLVTFLVVALNGLFADLVVAIGRRPLRHFLRVYAGVAVVATMVVASTVTRAEPRLAGGMRVALVQGNDLNRDLTLQEEIDRYLPTSHFDLAEDITGPVQLIVFPESSMDEDPREDVFLRDRLRRIAVEHRAWVVANATVDAPPDGEEVLNLNVVFGPDGRVVGTYAKRHLVPFGERVPFRGVLEGLVPAIEREVPRDMRPGDDPGLFEIAGVRTGMLICYESVFARDVRSLVRDGAEVLLVSTNNRSYRRSANSEQHLAIGQMRVAETGRPLLQAAISGITAVIDADGVVRERTALFERTVLEQTVAATSGQTPYVRYGEWVLAASVLVVAVAIALGLVRRRRQASLDLRAAEETVSIESRIAGYSPASNDDPSAPEPAPSEPITNE